MLRILGKVDVLCHHGRKHGGNIVMKSIQFTVELRMEAEKKVSKLSAGVVAS